MCLKHSRFASECPYTWYNVTDIYYVDSTKTFSFLGMMPPGIRPGMMRQPGMMYGPRGSRPDLQNVIEKGPEIKRVPDKEGISVFIKRSSTWHWNDAATTFMQRRFHAVCGLCSKDWEFLVVKMRSSLPHVPGRPGVLFSDRPIWYKVGSCHPEHPLSRTKSLRKNFKVWSHLMSEST